MRTLGRDGSEGKTQLHEQAFNEEDGTITEVNIITGKRFLASSDIGPQYESEREQMVEELKGMVDSLKETQVAERYLPAVIALMLENIQGPGTEVIKKLVRQDLMLQGLVEPETDEEKAFMAKVQQAQQQPDAQEDLARAVAEQARSEGRERDSKTLVNAADAGKKVAETKKILSDVEDGKVKTFIDIRREVLGNVQGLPLK